MANDIKLIINFMKKVFLLLMTVTTMLSCSKDNNQTVDEKKDCIITTVDMGVKDEGILHLKYDSQNRVSQVKFEMDETDWGGKHRMLEYNISYTSNNVTIIGDEPALFTLDSKGRIIKSVESDSGEHTYIYNSEGFLEKIISKGNTDHVFTYLNGNLKSYVNDPYNIFTEYDLNNPYVPYSYDITQQSGIIHYAYGIVLYEQGYYGKKSQNRVRQVSGSGIGGGKHDYSYIQDEKTGKMKSVFINQKYDSSTDLERVNFSYSCD
ncbi:hypothetical protein [Sphingobacterium sp. MYb388]|uniref:hypothetical protein n=1 Tax=Sphingobacterium sp. MYb388 TaxID=2745437 RepID=UPI0030B3DC7A